MTVNFKCELPKQPVATLIEAQYCWCILQVQRP